MTSYIHHVYIHYYNNIKEGIIIYMYTYYVKMFLRDWKLFVRLLFPVTSKIWENFCGTLLEQFQKKIQSLSHILHIKWYLNPQKLINSGTYF